MAYRHALTSFIFASFAVFAAACASVPAINGDSFGKFSGSLIVLWLGEGGSSGDGHFLFVPDPDDPLTFRRPVFGTPGDVISPGLMYTDGGSIPRIAQVFRGFSPWGYAPAYMIHDWLFTARHCIVDGLSDTRFEALEDVTLADSAEILGEAIRALVIDGRVAKNDLARTTITSAVRGAIAARLWRKRGACEALRVSLVDIAAAEAAIPGAGAFAFGFDELPALPEGVEVPRARVVSRISF